jgi:hypothetical protein
VPSWTPRPRRTPPDDRRGTPRRPGLEDTAAAHEAAGSPPGLAALLAVRDFGTTAVLVPGCQRELTLAQVRRTAGAVLLAVPLLAACALLVHHTGGGGTLPSAARVLALHLAALAGLAALFSGAALLVTGPPARRLPVPRMLPRAAAWAGTTASAAMAAAALTLATAAIGAADRPLLVAAGALAAAAHAVTATPARACRRCARLPLAPSG